MIPINSDLTELLSLLNRHSVRYLVIGGYAYSFHVQPRYTKDLDIFVAISTENSVSLFAALEEFGAPLKGVTAADLVSPDKVYIIGAPPFRVDFLTSVLGLDFESAWAARQEAIIHNVPVNMLSREDLIAAKRAAGRPRDLLDVSDLELGL